VTFADKRRCFARRFSFAAAFIAVLLALGPAVRAQGPPPADRLPADTIFYFTWRGLAPQSDAEKKNHLLQLWNDPDLAPLRLSASLGIQRALTPKGQSSPPVVFGDLVSLLDNGSTLGFVLLPPPAKPSSASPASRVALFTAYNTAGKAQLAQKVRDAIRAQSKGEPIVRTYDFGGTSVEVRTTSSGTSYSAQTGDYFLFSDKQEVVEELIARFRAAEKPPSSVAQLADYQKAKPYLDSGALVKFFGHLPDLSQFVTPDEDGKKLDALNRSLHLGKIHALAGSLSFDGEATRYHAALLGDTSPGGIFDLWGPSAASFQMQPVVETAPLYSIARLDLSAFYLWLRDAIGAVLPAQQAGGVMMFEGMAQSYLGMPVAEALALFTGELASLTTFSDDGAAQRTFAVAIQKPQDVLRLLRALLASQIVAEDSSGGVTYLDLSFPYRDSATGQQRRTFYYVAVSPQLAVIAQRKATLRTAIERFNAKLPARAAAPDLARLRSRLPEKLSGLSEGDLTRVPWDNILAGLAAELKETARESSKESQSNDQPAPDFGLAKTLKGDVITRHLHVAASGWWKDPNGVYFDSYLQ